MSEPNAGDIRAARKHFGLTREIVRRAAMQRIESSEGYVTKDYPISAGVSDGND